jgi:hypothetical protein
VGLSLSFLEDDGDTNAELDKTRVPNIVPFALCLHWMRPYSGAAAPAPTAAAGPGAVAGMAGPVGCLNAFVTRPQDAPPRAARSQLLQL